MPNYLVDRNPFQMTPPPAWWLREMALFDPQLVLFPSMRNATFILARRATRSGGEPLHGVKGLTQNPDTLFMHAYRLVRVCEILPGVIWDMRVFQRLANHDIQRLGGYKKVNALLETRDAQQAQAIQTQQEDEITARAHDAYRAYKTRIGERLSLGANPTGRGTVTPNRVSVPVRRVSPSARRILSPPDPGR